MDEWLPSLITLIASVGSLASVIAAVITTRKRDTALRKAHQTLKTKDGKISGYKYREDEKEVGRRKISKATSDE